MSYEDTGEWAIDKIDELREQLTILKAERDEARADASGLYQKLFDLLCFIHGDPIMVNNIGLDAAITEAVALIANREREATQGVSSQ